MLLDPIYSVAKLSFYQEVPKKSFGATVGYLTYLGVIFSIALTSAMYVQLRPRIASAVEWAAANIPPMTLYQGKLSSSLKEPLVMRHPQVQDAGFIIDTNRTTPVTASEMEQKRVVGYLTQSAIYVMTKERMETYDLSKATAPKPLSIDANFYRTVGKVLNQVLYPIAFVTTIAIFLVWKHGAALVYSLLALLINAALSSGLEFPALYNISVYSMTPVVLLQIATLFFPRPIPFFGVLALLIVGLYIWQAIRQQGVQPENPAA